MTHDSLYFHVFGNLKSGRFYQKNVEAAKQVDFTIMPFTSKCRHSCFMTVTMKPTLKEIPNYFPCTIYS